MAAWQGQVAARTACRSRYHQLVEGITLNRIPRQNASPAKSRHGRSGSADRRPVACRAAASPAGAIRSPRPAHRLRSAIAPRRQSKARELDFGNGEELDIRNSSPGLISWTSMSEDGRRRRRRLSTPLASGGNPVPRNSRSWPPLARGASLAPPMAARLASDATPRSLFPRACQAGELAGRRAHLNGICLARHRNYSASIQDIEIAR